MRIKNILMVVLTSILSLTVVLASSQQAYGATTVSNTVVNTFETPCQHVVWIGARGSGTPDTEGDGMGNQVKAAYDRFRAALLSPSQLPGASLRVGYRAVPYTAADVSTLFPPETTPFFGSIDVGVLSVVSFLYARTTQCSDEKYVFAGHSQGAMVMHRVVQYLSENYSFPGSGDINAGDKILKRILAVVAIADGDRDTRDKHKTYGSAANAGSPGIARAVGSESPWAQAVAASDFPIADKILPSAPRWDSSKRFLSICDHFDPVCDYGGIMTEWGVGGPLIYGPIMLANAKTTHSNYANGQPLTDAANDAAKLFFDTIVPLAISVKAPAAVITGRPLSIQPVATGGTPPYRWGATGLPSGVTINSSTGLVSGTPTVAGPVRAIITVRDALGTTKMTTLQSLVAQSWSSLAANGPDGNVWQRACGITSSGSVSCWGDNYGGLVSPSFNPDNPDTYFVNVPTPNQSFSSGARELEVGQGVLCVLMTDTSLRCLHDYASNSVRTIPGLEAGVKSFTIDKHGMVGCAIMTSSEVRCFGGIYGSDSQILFGDAEQALKRNWQSFSVPSLYGATTIDATKTHICATFAAGEVRCLGQNSQGELGLPGGDSAEARPVPGLGAAAKFVVAEDFATCASLGNAGVKCWGMVPGWSSKPWDYTTTPTAIPNITNATSLDFEQTTLCAVESAGAVKCRGFSSVAGMFYPASTQTATALAIPGLRGPARKVVAMQDAACVLLVDTTTQCWGTNNDGVLGRGLPVPDRDPKFAGVTYLPGLL